MNKELFKTITDKLNFSLRHKTPVILQSEAAECGIACLAMVCGFYGLNIDLFNFRHRYGSPSQGVTLMSLSKTAEHAGLKSRALSLDLDEIKQLKLPCIIHWGMNHYVVLTKVRKSSFIVHDPALGKGLLVSRRCPITLPALPWSCGQIKTSNRNRQSHACACWT